MARKKSRHGGVQHQAKAAASAEKRAQRRRRHEYWAKGVVPPTIEYPQVPADDGHRGPFDDKGI